MTLTAHVTFSALMSDKLTPLMPPPEIPHQSFCKHLLNTFLSPCLCLQFLLNMPRNYKKYRLNLDLMKATLREFPSNNKFTEYIICHLIPTCKLI